MWLDRKYAQSADTTAYAKDRPLDGRDPFQALYNRVANDLLRAREQRKPKELGEAARGGRAALRRLHVARSLCGYLATEDEGREPVVRLPAADDPMVARVAAIRERDHMLIDTLNEYY